MNGNLFLDPMGRLSTTEPAQRNSAYDSDGLVLLVSDTLEVHQRTNPTDTPQAVQVTCNGFCIIIEDEKQRISLVISLDEMRAIMRLFDHESED